MKHKNGMTRLRNKIIRYFIIVVLLVSVIESVIDSVWDVIIAPGIYPGGDYNGVTDIYTIGYIGVSILLYVLSAVVFYQLIKKAVEKESAHQIKEQNLLYAAIAHDLKTPMTSVLGFAKVLSEGRVRPEERQEIYDIIFRKSNSMNELVNTLFEYAKLGTEEYDLQLEKTDMCVLFRDIIAEHYCEFEEHNIALEVDIPDTAITVRADRNELKRAFSNLLVNTYRHNPDGIKVRLCVREKDGKCIVAVADTGYDIPEDMKVFEPFVTENTARTFGNGTGLGLAITKRIIDRHKACIYIDRNFEGFTKAFVIEWVL